jgi:hypothetical protein
VQIEATQEHHAFVCFKTRRKTMTNKLKLVLVAAIAAVSLASPALAQTANTHQERSLRSEQSQQAPGYSADGAFTQQDGSGSGYAGPSAE